jgi:hypothetical protein
VISLNHFIANTDEPTDDYDVDGLTRATILGSEIIAVMLHSEMLAEDRVERMNALRTLSASVTRWSSRCASRARTDNRSTCAGYKADRPVSQKRRAERSHDYAADRLDLTNC